MTWRLDPAKAGLVVIDVQDKLVAAMPDRDGLIDRITRLVRIARLFEMPVFLTEQLPDKLGPTVPAIADAAGKPAPLVKSTFSASPVLADPLPRTLVLCGIETHVCVRQSAYDLRARERIVHLAADASASRHEEDRRLALEELRHDNVLLTSVEALAWEMLGSAEHPRFKDALAILK
jgi:nicotinamidase-related amidase